MIGWFDPMYLLFIGPPMLLAMWASMKVKSTFASASQVPVSSGVSGAEAARAILDANGLRSVNIEESHGMLSDHYDPRAKVLRLSHDVYFGRSMASVGIAAHEAGHAIQDAKGYAPLALRNGLVPLAMTGGYLSWGMLMVGVMIMAASQGGNPLGRFLLIGGIALFAITVVFQIVNLPVEFDASKRAKDLLAQMGIVHQTEMQPVKSVLSAAALTYVAGTLTAVMQLVYLLVQYGGLLGGHRDES